MKRLSAIMLNIILLVNSGCGGNSQVDDDLITIDVTKSYPKKELILQDFMDVEYIVLETNDDFLTQGSVKSVGDDIILVKNRFDDGDIFVFDRTGKGIRKINRKGQSGEEYITVYDIVLDEDKDEIFVSDPSAKKITVYDLFGQFIRSFRHNEGIKYYEMYNYDQDYLVCRDGNLYLEGTTERSADLFFIISKQDGEIFKEIKIPFTKETSPFFVVMDKGLINIAFYNQITLHKGNWIFTAPSSDTIFRYLPDYTIMPFIIRTPSIQSMDPVTFLVPGILTDCYYFMESIKKEYNFESQTGFPSKKLMYDKQDKTVYEYTVFNDDYATRTVDMSSRDVINEKIAFYERLEAFELVEAYKNGELKGHLKEIAANLDVESNPVIMLVKHKNNN